MSAIKQLAEVIDYRKTNPQEGSYTCYLFEKGVDKILKKCGEECTEMVIAAKNNDPEELKNEIADLVYHTLVLMAEQGIPVEEVETILNERSKKIGNLKQFHQVDKDS